MLRRRLFSRDDAARSEPEPYEPPANEDVGEFKPSTRGQSAVHDLQGARRTARERYWLTAEALKREAGIRRHYRHKGISGLAWLNDRKILAPEGITRRQLYVIAHECGHIVLHSQPEA